MLISVVITAYNYARYVERAIRSVLNQSIHQSKYEIIVVNDASTDETREVLENYKEEVRIINLEENVGLAEARNIGIRKARGQFVVFVDADDYIHSDMLYVQSLFLLENNYLDAVAVDYILVDDKERHLEIVSAAQYPIACGIMFRKERLIDIGMYDKNFKAREDEDLRIRFLRKYNIYNIILPLYRYRKHGQNLTNNVEKMEEYAASLQNKHYQNIPVKEFYTSNIKIYGKKVYLRPIQLSDVTDKYVHWLNDKEVIRGLENPVIPYTKDRLQQYILKMISTPDNYMFAIIDVRSNEHIGNVKLHNFNEHANHCEVGIMIGDKNFWNKGVGTEALSLVLWFAFDVLKVNKVWASVHQTNLASLNLFQKLGFIQEGILRKHTVTDHRWVDKIMLGIFEHEFKSFQYAPPHYTSPHGLYTTSR